MIEWQKKWKGSIRLLYILLYMVYSLCDIFLVKYNLITFSLLQNWLCRISLSVLYIFTNCKFKIDQIRTNMKISSFSTLKLFSNFHYVITSYFDHNLNPRQSASVLEIYSENFPFNFLFSRPMGSKNPSWPRPFSDFSANQEPEK